MGEMRLKVTIVLTIALALGDRSLAGVISLEGEALHGQQDPLEQAYQEQHATFATSYMQFHGPVQGPEYEVKVPHVAHPAEDNHLYRQEEWQQEYTVDYVAHPKYEFSYGVEDHDTGDFHQQKESRDGSSVSGQYSVKEPGGSVRIVSYRADKDGFHAVVHTSGKNEHSTSVYGDQGQAQVHDHQIAVQQEHDYVPDQGY